MHYRLSGDRIESASSDYTDGKGKDASYLGKVEVDFICRALVEQVLCPCPDLPHEFLPTITCATNVSPNRRELRFNSVILERELNHARSNQSLTVETKPLSIEPLNSHVSAPLPVDDMESGIAGSCERPSIAPSQLTHSIPSGSLPVACSKEPRISYTKEDLFSHLVEVHQGFVSVKVATIRHFTKSMGSLTFWFGPAMNQRWVQEGTHYHKALSPVYGHGFCVAVQLPWYYWSRGTVTFVIFRRPRQFHHLSVQCNISFPRVIPRDAAVIRLTQVHDVHAVKEMFKAGDASPCDVTLDGISLLHVCITFSRCLSHVILSVTIDRRKD